MNTFDSFILRRALVATCMTAAALGWQSASALGFGTSCIVNASTGASGGNSMAKSGFCDSEESASAGNTAGFYIDVVTPGGAFTTSSGHSYATVSAVPEPSTWMFLTAGVLGLALVSHRREAKR